MNRAKLKRTKDGVHTVTFEVEAVKTVEMKITATELAEKLAELNTRKEVLETKLTDVVATIEKLEAVAVAIQPK